MNICKLRFQKFRLIFKNVYNLSVKRYYEILKVKPNASA